MDLFNDDLDFKTIFKVHYYSKSIDLLAFSHWKWGTATEARMVAELEKVEWSFEECQEEWLKNAKEKILKDSSS